VGDTGRNGLLISLNPDLAGDADAFEGDIPGIPPTK